ncbi:MAG: AzlC family ABC transporter permease [Huintestinicola sp.]
MKKIIKQAFTDTIPVLTGYIVLGFGFGIVLRANGYGIWWALIMSLFIYAGSMQYAAIGLLTSGASLFTAALTTLMVNARHLFYGISMLDNYKNTGKFKPYLIFSLTDETYSLVCKDNINIPEKHKKNYYFFVSLFDQIYWVAGSVLGAAAGNMIRFNSNGIEFALTALFLTVLTDQWLSAKDHKPALTGILVSLICLLVFGRDIFLIPSMLMIAVLLCIYTEKKDND